MSTDPLSREATFLVSAYRTSHSIEDVTALAKRVQTLLIAEPGSFPSNVAMGVGIGTYLHEFADQITLDEINTKVKTQIDKYLPGAPIRRTEVKFITDPTTGTSGLAIFFELTTGTTVDKNSFALVFKRRSEGGSGTVLSDFYF